MKKLSPGQQSQHQRSENSSKQASDHPGIDLEQDDELWNLLGNATETKPGDFFARNVIREARLQQETEASKSWLQKFTSWISPRQAAPYAVGAAACMAIALFFFWPNNQQSNSQPNLAQNKEKDSMEEISSYEEDDFSDFSELVIQETLIAAADDPSLITDEEMVEILGL